MTTRPWDTRAWPPAGAELAGEKVLPVPPGPARRAGAAAAVPHARSQPGRVRLHPVRPLLDHALPPAEGRRPLAADEAQQPGHPLVGEVLDVGGVRVQRALDV